MRYGRSSRLEPTDDTIYIPEATLYELIDSVTENQYSDISFWLQRNWLFWQNSKDWSAIDYWSQNK